MKEKTHSKQINSVYDELKKHLETSPKARERKNRMKFFSWLLETKYRTYEGISGDKLGELIHDAITYDSEFTGY